MHVSKRVWERMSLENAKSWLKENLGEARGYLDLIKGLRRIGRPEFSNDYRTNYFGWNWMGVWVQHPKGVIFFETTRY